MRKFVISFKLLVIKVSYHLSCTDATFSRVDPQFALLADTGVSRKEHQDFHSHYVHLTNESNTFAHPHAAIVVPVFRELNNAIESDIVASIGGVLPFDHFLADLAPDDADGIHGKLQPNGNWIA